MKAFLLRAVVGAALALGARLPTLAQETDRLITRAIEVRALAPADAERGHPVRLRGVVVFVDNASAIFLQDGTSTTFFRTREAALPRVGDEIELTGKTRMGLYLPGLDFSTTRVLGRRPLPAGIPAQFDDLVSGRYHYERVTLEGIIRSVSLLDARRSRIRLAMGTRVIEAHVERPPQEERSLVDHRVRVTGLAVGIINKRRQLVQPYLRVLDWGEVEVLAPAPPVADVPLISAEELLAFRVTGHGEQRVRVEGVVTAVFPGDHVYLRQGDMAFGVRIDRSPLLAAGDRILIAGFPEMERSSASVVDAELLNREPGPPPLPEAVPSPDQIAEIHDCRLVTVTGHVRDAFKTDEGTTIILAGKARTLQARLPSGTEAPDPGSRVRITGIAQVELARSASGFGASAGIASLRSRQPGDFVVLQKPSWWTVRRLVGILAVLAGVTIFAGLWIAILRRQVRRQTEALRIRIESEAALEERQRIAREFHDTLEQELAGVSLRLDALATRVSDEKGSSLIKASRNLVSRIQTETRDLICDLRDATESAGDIVAALAGAATRQSADTGIDVRLEPAEDIPLLPAAIVHDLRMVARESATNAIRHGRATQVRFRIERRGPKLVLAIVDNGCGFDAATATEGRRGHFGCAGIRERARKIGAEVTWRSVLQKGATVEIHLPLPGNTPPPPARATTDTPGAPQPSPTATPALAADALNSSLRPE